MNAKRTIIARAWQAAGGLALAALIGGAPAALAASETNSANLSIAVAGQADAAVSGDGIDTYVLTVTNRGGGVIEGLTLSVPIEPGHQLAGASFSRDNAWVSARGDGAASIRIEGMRGVGDSVSATLTFASPTSAQGSALGERLTASWSTEDEDFTAQSNLPASGVQTLAVAGGGAGYSLSSSIFAPGEPVTFWYSTAAGSSTRLVVVDGVLGLQPAESDIEEISYSTYALAGPTGALDIAMSAAGVAPGTYTLVAYGNWTGASAAASVRLP